VKFTRLLFGISRLHRLKRQSATSHTRPFLHTPNTFTRAHQTHTPNTPTTRPTPGALKSGFTRTGKRTLGGLVDDGVKSVVRYYLNNFKVRTRGGELAPGLRSVRALPRARVSIACNSTRNQVKTTCSILQTHNANTHANTQRKYPHAPRAQDGHKQDALDLISGAYTVKKDVKLRFRRQVRGGRRRGRWYRQKTWSCAAGLKSIFG
jgi:hypothetical protein